MATVKVTRFWSSVVQSVLVAAMLLAPAPASAQDATPLDRFFDAPLDFRPLDAPGTYAFLRQETPRKIYLRITPEQGWNASTTTNDGRTGLSAVYIWVDHEGQGDGGGVTVVCRAFGAARGAALANPACVLVNGQVDAAADGALMNPGEWHMRDYGRKNVSGIGWHVESWYDGPAEDPSVFRVGYSHNVAGADTADSHFRGGGKAHIGLDLSTHQSQEDRAAIAIPRGDCIYYSVRPPLKPPARTRELGQDATCVYDYDDAPGVHTVMTIVGGIPTLQVQPGWLAVDGGISSSGDVLFLGLPTGGQGRHLCIDGTGRVYVASGNRC